jgi:hypothetical protein
VTHRCLACGTKHCSNVSKAKQGFQGSKVHPRYKNRAYKNWPAYAHALCCTFFTLISAQVSGKCGRAELCERIIAAVQIWRGRGTQRHRARAAACASCSVRWPPTLPIQRCMLFLCLHI